MAIHLPDSARKQNIASILFAHGVSIAMKAIWGVLAIAVLALAQAFPAAALTLDEIDGVYAQEFPGGAQGLRWEVHLFLKNGQAYRRIDVPIESLDIDAVRKAEPDRWVSWRKEGKQFIFTAADGEKTRPKIVWKMHPGSDGADLAGKTFSFTGSYRDSLAGQGANAVAWGESFHFLDDGRYATGQFSGFSGSQIKGYMQKNPAASGSYFISGYTIVLTPDKGEPRRELFFFGDSKGAPSETVIGIAGRFLLLEK
jgi:hypothetical protein